MFQLAKDGDLYDEFGNYIGPELDSDDEEDSDDSHDDIEAEKYPDYAGDVRNNFVSMTH